MNSEKFPMLAKTMFGLEEVLARELSTQGAEQIVVVNRAVEFIGNIELMYKANYWCRTALHILVPISEFYIRKEEDLYKKINQIDWENYLDKKGTLSVDAVVHSSIFTHSHYVALKTKDAVVDRFRDKFGKRPNVDVDLPDLKINIYINRNKCIVSLDSSGNSLHKRGYRKKTGSAPLSEVLAAGMIMLSGWNGQSNFIDPMCGSGTIVCEAALIANNIPPGYYRKTFGFEKWKNFDNKTWEKVKKDALQFQKEFDHEIIGSDISAECIAIAKENAHYAKLHKDIKFEIKSFENQLPPEDGGIMMINPPYGERIKPEDIIKLYKTIGDGLKNNYQGYKAWIISSDFNAIKFIGLKPSKKISLYNGSLECKFLQYDIYHGSKKSKNP